MDGFPILYCGDGVQIETRIGATVFVVVRVKKKQRSLTTVRFFS